MGNFADMYPQFGTGNFRQARVFTDGKLRWSFDPLTGALTAEAGLDEPATSPQRPQWFFRLSGTRWQICARFPSGATQILASEP